MFRRWKLGRMARFVRSGDIYLFEESHHKCISAFFTHRVSFCGFWLEGFDICCKNASLLLICCKQIQIRVVQCLRLHLSFRLLLHSAGVPARKNYCNRFLEVKRNSGFLETANIVFQFPTVRFFRRCFTHYGGCRWHFKTTIGRERRVDCGSFWTIWAHIDDIRCWPEFVILSWMGRKALQMVLNNFTFVEGFDEIEWYGDLDLEITTISRNFPKAVLLVTPRISCSWAITPVAISWLEACM